MAGPRAQAVNVLRDRTKKGTSLDRLFQSTAHTRLSHRDRRLSKELVYGVFRNLALLDYFISHCSQRPLVKIDDIILWILRLSLYQIEFLRVPDYAAVHEAGDLCRIFRKSSAHSFVNGILRTFLRSRPSLPSDSSPRALAIRYSHPEWLVRRYVARYGTTEAERALRLNNKTPLATLWINPFKTSVAEFRKVLDQEGISYEAVSELPDAVRVVARSFTEHKQYKEGNCFFMDASSQRIAYLVDLCDSRLVADLCSAPGGKAFLMASRLQPGGRIFCSDINADRLRQTRRRADLYGITELSFVQMDLTVGTAYTNCFDAVLLDVPCSGTGTFRANPDARWRMGEEDLLRFQQRQLKLFHSAFSILGPGRELVYSTCSTEPEENEHVVEQFLASEESAELSAGYFQTLPYRDQGEGFFAARVRRV